MTWSNDETFQYWRAVRPENHFMLPASTRLPELRRLIDQQAYFIVHAPRQVGKATSLMQLAQELTSQVSRRDDQGLGNVKYGC